MLGFLKHLLKRYKFALHGKYLKNIVFYLQCGLGLGDTEMIHS